MSYCYIIRSEKLNRFYVGATQGDLNQRIDKHNNKDYGDHRFTAKANDWVLFLDIPIEDYSHAIRIERKIKAQKSAKYIRNLALYPEMIIKLKKSCS